MSRGVYSRKNIEEAGGRLANTDNFNTKQLQVGDVIFFHTRVSLFSWLIMYWTNGIWSHTGMSSGNGKIIHAISEGVVEEDVDKYLDNKSYLSILTPEGVNEEKMYSFMKSALGSKYAWGKALWLGVLILNNQASGYRPRLTIDFIILPYLLIFYLSNSIIVNFILSVSLIVHFSLLIKSHENNG